MLRIQLFGELIVYRDGRRVTAGLDSQHVQALVTMLALHEGGGVDGTRCDALLAPGAACATLFDALDVAIGAGYRLRGVDVPTFDPDAVWTDVGEFRRALAAGDLERAVQLCTGRLVDGFHLRHAPEFDRWLQVHRDALASECAAALEQLAERATRRNEPLAAVRWWRQLAAQYPLNDRIAASLMEALVAAGDREGAVRHARFHEALAAQHLDVPGDAHVLALANAIRRGERSRPAPLAGPLVPEVPGAGTLQRFAVALAGRYQLEREIGRGGYGRVLLASDLRHDRAVAIKVMHPEHATGNGSERFLREIRTVASLQHPNILPLFDSGIAAGTLYYVMPYVEGESLRERLRRDAPLPVHEAVSIAGQVAGALAAAHARGIVHRDIKPENLLISGGQAMVTDFGIARAIDSTSQEHLTIGGAAVGTPIYMSPEQAVSSPLDGRSDIYSLACVLYEMLTGEPPFTGPTVQAVLANHATAAIPSVRSHRPELPASLESTLRRALAKEPAERHASAEAFAQVLARSISDWRGPALERWLAFPAGIHAGTLFIALVAIVVLAMAVTMTSLPEERQSLQPRAAPTHLTVEDR